jgi:hypothetical protein
MIATMMPRRGGRFSRDGQWQWDEEVILTTTRDELAKGPGNGFVNPPTSIAVLRVAPDNIKLGLRLYCLLDATGSM